MSLTNQSGIESHFKGRPSQTHTFARPESVLSPLMGYVCVQCVLTPLMGYVFQPSSPSTEVVSNSTTAKKQKEGVSTTFLSNIIEMKLYLKLYFRKMVPQNNLFKKSTYNTHSWIHFHRVIMHLAIMAKQCRIESWMNHLDGWSNNWKYANQ